MAQPLRLDVFSGADAADAWASRRVCAHSSQHTSTVLPPTFTAIALASSSQSQAAQVFAVMIRSLFRSFEGQTSGTRTRKRAGKIACYRDL
jgi:hypothetical protein